MIGMKLKVVIREEMEDGGYSISCPALPGCHSQGESVEEALENIREAIIGCFEVLNDRAKARESSSQILEVVV